MFLDIGALLNAGVELVGSINWGSGELVTALLAGGLLLATIALIAIREPGHAKARPYKNTNTRRARPVIGHPATVHP